MVFCRSWSTPPLGNLVFRYWRRSLVIEPEKINIKNMKQIIERVCSYFLSSQLRHKSQFTIDRINKTLVD